MGSLHFAQPWYLLGLVVPVAMLVWVWTRKGRRVALPFDQGSVKKGTGLRVLLQLGETLAPLALAVGVILAAGPQTLDAPKTKRSLTNIQFCVDISGSMTSSFGEGTRYDAAMKAINSFLDYRQGDAFGLSFFGNNVLHWVPLTSDVGLPLRAAVHEPSNRALPPWFGARRSARRSKPAGTCSPRARRGIA
ncbi:MAG: VWA domain-containing protein [Planctomycetota bacterium]